LEIKNQVIMEKGLKKVEEGQGFVCKDFKEKKRIWKKLTNAGYQMICSFESSRGDHIVSNLGMFMGSNAGSITDPLNEAEFFDGVSTFGVDFANTDSVDSIAYATHDMKLEWTPKPGEWVEVSLDGIDWDKRQYLCTIDGIHLCVGYGEDIAGCDRFVKIKYIRQIPLETMTLQEAKKKLSALLDKPNLIIIP
jgi:hypothetical protein